MKRRSYAVVIAVLAVAVLWGLAGAAQYEFNVEPGGLGSESITSSSGDGNFDLSVSCLVENAVTWSHGVFIEDDVNGTQYQEFPELDENEEFEDSGFVEVSDGDYIGHVSGDEQDRGSSVFKLDYPLPRTVYIDRART